MNHAARYLSSFVIAVCLMGMASAQQAVPANAVILEDKATWQQLADEFFSAYTREDLDGLLRMWSDKSPEFPAFIQRVQQQFTTWEKITVKAVTVRQMKVDGERAKLRVELEMNAIDAKTGKPAAGLGKLLRALECVKEGGVWRVWREASAYDELATALGEVDCPAVG
jgi:hypothetical protein